MKVVEPKFDTEVISQAPIEAAQRKYARDRKALITGTRGGTELAQFNPNGARSGIDHPAVYPSDEDYVE